MNTIATSQQLDRINQLNNQLEGLKEYLNDYPDDNSDQRFEGNLKAAELALDIEEPYRLVLIGKTGVGKSTLANALLNRDLLFTRAEGRPATGTVLEVFQTASPGDEYALVYHRNQAEISDFIRTHFVEPYKKANAFLGEVPRELDNAYLEDLENLKTDIKGTAFELAHKSVVNMLTQHLNNPQLEPEVKMLLNTDRERQNLADLIDEDSKLNRGKKAKIALVKKISYHIAPRSDDNKLLNLPPKTCLVDLPGVHATLLHNSIIQESIRNAGVVIFLFEGLRLDVTDEHNLIKEILENKFIDDPNQIFLVVNRWDRPPDENDPERESLKRIMHEIATNMKSLSKRDGDLPFFRVSAAAARLSGKLLSSKDHKLTDLEQRASAEYMAAYPDVKSNQAMFEASGITNLVEQLNNVAKNSIRDRIRIAQGNLSSITDTLKKEFRPKDDPKVIAKELEDLQRADINDVVNDLQNNMDGIIEKFHETRNAGRSDLARELEEVGNKVCNSLKTKLTKNFRDLWNKSCDERPHPITRRQMYVLNEHAFLANFCLEVCDLLLEEFNIFRETIVSNYEDPFRTEGIRGALMKAGLGLPGLEKALNEEELSNIISQLDSQLRKAIEVIIPAVLMDPNVYDDKNQAEAVDLITHLEIEDEEIEDEEIEDEEIEDEELEKALASLEKSLFSGGIVVTLVDLWKAFKLTITKLTDELDKASDGYSQRVKEDTDIGDLIEAVVGHYSLFVKKWSINALLNFYTFVLLKNIEESLKAIILKWVLEIKRVHPSQIELRDESEEVKALKAELAKIELGKDKLKQLEALQPE